MARGGPALAGSVLFALAAAGAAPAAAQGASPYDMTFAIRGGAEAPLRAAQDAAAAPGAPGPAGASGIVLRWCRSEIPFGAWQFGSRSEQLKLLDSRWCEVSWQGKVGNIPGSLLQPE